VHRPSGSLRTITIRRARVTAPSCTVTSDTTDAPVRPVAVTVAKWPLNRAIFRPPVQFSVMLPTGKRER